MSPSQEQLTELKTQLEQKRSELATRRGEDLTAGTQSDDGAYPDRSGAGTRAEQEQELLD